MDVIIAATQPAPKSLHGRLVVDGDVEAVGVVAVFEELPPLLPSC